MNQRKYFGTDGIRGTVGMAPITPDFMMRLGNAVGVVLKSTIDNPQVCIGKDTRISGYMIESALEAGLISAGVDVALTGPIPTPGVAYLTRAMRMDMGIVITASHNPYWDNGIKFFSAGGVKFDDDWELIVESLLEESMRFVSASKLGKAIRIDDAAGRYIEFCKSTFDLNLSLKGLKIVVDAANGAAYHTAKSVFHELGATVVCVACAPDGININEGVGATHPEFLVSKVMEHRADYGIALDGDADRLQMVDGDGRLFNGDEIMYLMAKDRQRSGQRVEGVVGTLMTNMAVEHALKLSGIKLVRAKVGDRYVLEELVKHGWDIGGESSGHLLDVSKHTTGDGTISALLVLQAVARSGKSMSELLNTLKMYPQHMVNVRFKEKVEWDTPMMREEIQRVADVFGDKGRVLIRASGTEPVVRVMVEHENSAVAKMAAESLAEVMQTVVA